MNNNKQQTTQVQKQLILSCEKLETRVALLNNNRLEEYKVERKNEDAIVGSIYLGRITNLEPSLQAAFVDIGAEKNAFLHYWDMLPASYDMMDKVNRSEQEANTKKTSSSFSKKIRNLLSNDAKPQELKERETRRRRKKITIKDIPTLFPEGSEILVQVTKGPIGTKGSRVTTNISMPGRYVVLLPYSDQICLSSKIDDRRERTRLRKILTGLDLPEEMGLICRTVAEGRKGVFFKRDLDMLLDYWHKVETSMEKPTVPSLVYREPNLAERTARDLLTEDIDEIVVDDPEALKTLLNIVKKFVDRKTSNKIKLYKRATPIFNHYKITRQVSEIFKREARLPSGGHICIDETEALIAIDVNTGKGKKKTDHPATILRTNLEAADEIARQLKLRNIGGLVVIDFIDMRPAKDRDEVLKTMRKRVKNDRAKTKVLPISKFGIMEMSRQREHESLKDSVSDLCPYCTGSGRIKSAMSMSVEIQRKLHEVLKRHHSEKGISVRIIMHPSILARLKNEDAGLFLELEKTYGKNLTFRADDTIHHEDFRLVDAETNVEY